MFEFSNEKTEAALESVRMRSHAEEELHEHGLSLCVSNQSVSLRFNLKIFQMHLQLECLALRDTNKDHCWPTRKNIVWHFFPTLLTSPMKSSAPQSASLLEFS